MTTIVMLRHAAAAAGDNDIERVLSPEGEKQTHQRSMELEALGLRHADHVYCSPALRAQQTARHIFPYSTPIYTEESLYAACLAEGMADAYADLGSGVAPHVWKSKYPKIWAACVENAAKTKEAIAPRMEADATIAIVAHEVILNAVAAAFLEVPPMESLVLSAAIPTCGAIVLHGPWTISFHF
jgi:broad specificity phosphatase PhoE